MTATYDVAAIGNAIVDVIAPCDDAFLTTTPWSRQALRLRE